MSETPRTGSIEEASYLASIIATQHEIATAHLAPEALMDLIAGRTQALTRASGAAVELAEGDEMVYRASTGSAASHLGLRLRRDQSLSGLCVRTGEILRCDDSETDNRVDREACRRVGVRSMVVVPLSHGARIVGVLKVLSAEPDAFGERDVRTLQLLAGLLASALDRAAQFEDRRALLAERTAALAELYREREFLRAVLEHAGDGIVACDAAGELTVFNQAARQFHGLPALPLAPEAWAEHYDLRRVDGTPMPTTEVPLYRALNGECVRDAEMVIAPRSVPPRTLLASGRAILGPGGDRLGAVVVMQDVTSRREAEAERAARLAEQAARAESESAERRYRSLAEAIPQIVWTARADGSVEYFNNRWYDYTGLTPERSLGGGWVSAVHPEDLTRCLAHWSQAVASGEAYETEYRFLRASDGAYRWHLGRGTPRRDGDGRLVEWFGTCTDIDDQKRAALELSSSKEAAEAANRAKDEFLAVLSHELRTPLTPVLAAASALIDDPTTPALMRPTLELTRRNVELEARLIDDLLDVTRISRGELVLERERVDAHVVIHRALALCQEAIRSGGHRLEIDLSAPAHHVSADPVRLQQVIWNLVQNAAKFTRGQATIVVRTRSPEGADGPRLIVEVTDTGIGIEPDVLPTIFEAFRQGERLSKRRFGGLGLGLAIGQAVASAHGGTLTASSPGKGQGTTFLLELPTEAPDAEVVRGNREEPCGPPRADRAMRILLVEDDADTLRIMARLLRSRGCSVSPASRVSEALEVAAGGQFDLIISDIGLPDGTGWELMNQLKARGLTLGIALTGFGMEEDVRRSHEAGFVAHLTKPVNFQKLEATIQRVATSTHN